MQRWGFRGFADQVRRSMGGDPAPVAEEPADTAVQGELFPYGANLDAPDETETLTPQPVEGAARTCHLVDTPAKFDEFFALLRQQKRFAVDLETTDIVPLRSQPVGLAFSWSPGEAWYLPVRGPKGTAVLKPAPTLRKLAKVFEDAAVAKVNQN